MGLFGFLDSHNQTTTSTTNSLSNSNNVSTNTAYNLSEVGNIHITPETAPPVTDQGPVNSLGLTSSGAKLAIALAFGLGAGYLATRR